MKNFILFSGLLFFGITPALAQFNFESDTVILLMQDNVLNDLRVSIDNSASSSDLEYRWQEEERILNSGWDVQLCDCETCYSDYHSLPNGYIKDCDGLLAIPASTVFTEFKFSVNPNGIKEEGYLTLKFSEIGNLTNNRVLTFKAQMDPNASLGNILKRAELKAFSGPQYIQIQSNKNINNARVEFFSILGARVYQNNFNGNLFLIDNSNFSNGTYILRVTHNNGAVHTQKLTVH